MPRVLIGPLNLLPPSSLAQAEPGGAPVTVCNHNGVITAFHGLCPHRNGPLGHGNLDEGHILCPWHAWAFNCETGMLDGNPEIRLHQYPVTVEDGQIFVDIPD
jgi:nitrite reductase/ring-hydroxylating ferredoxin subunit